MEALWRDRDRQQQRQEMDLLAFLQMLDQRQRTLRDAARALVRESDSPKRRQLLAAAESAQRDLAEEIPTLKEKIEAGAAQSAAPPGAAGTPTAAKPDPSPEVKKAVETLQGMADASAKAMTTAADRLHGSKPGEAVAPQSEAVTQLDEIFRAAAPFPNLVQRALQTQDGLVQQSTGVVEKPEENKDADLGESAWNQGFVGRWSEALPPKAQQGLKDLEAQASAAPSPAPQTAQQAPVDPEEEKKQREGLRRSMQLAITLAPKVQKLSNEATEALRDGHPKEALPKQQEALKLLKEIAEPLPKKPPQEQPQQQPNEDQKQQDQQQQPQQGDQKKDDQQKQDQQQQSQPKPDQMPQQQAEAVLRQAQQRQQQRQQMEKQLQDRLYRPGPVEKDW